MRFFMKLETDRLFIRFLRLTDYPRWQRAYLDLDQNPKNIWDISCKIKSELSKKKFQGFVQQQRRSRAEDQSYEFALFLKSGEFIGYIVISELSRSIHQKASIGYRVLNPYWQKGYAKEALRAVLEFAFAKLHLHRIEALVEKQNLRSISILKKLKFRNEGICKKRVYARDQWQDVLLYALSSEQYQYFVHLDVSDEY